MISPPSCYIHLCLCRVDVLLSGLGDVVIYKSELIWIAAERNLTKGMNHGICPWPCSGHQGRVGPEIPVDNFLRAPNISFQLFFLDTSPSAFCFQGTFSLPRSSAFKAPSFGVEFYRWALWRLMSPFPYFFFPFLFSFIYVFESVYLYSIYVEGGGGETLPCFMSLLAIDKCISSSQV